MKKKEFQSSFSDYTDTSNCGLETERRTEKGFEAYIYNENIRVINRNAYSTTITDIVGTQAKGSELNDKIINDLKVISKGFISSLFQSASMCGYSYSQDHKMILLSTGSESRMINREDFVRVCEFVTNGDMSPEVIRSIISIVDKDEFSSRLYDLMIEYAMG